MSEMVSCPSCGAPLAEGIPCDNCLPVTEPRKRPGGKASFEISGYKILGLIGAGGMGQVYLAEDVLLKRRIAIKIIHHKQLNNELAEQRFLREAQMMAQLEHPNIVRIYGFGKQKTDTYLLMEYIDGESLQQRIARLGRLSHDEALRILIDIVSGLQAAWEKGIVHRDIKPSNILIDQRGNVRVADFGLAKSIEVDAATTLTEGGIIAGTPKYISPEQIEGSSADFRSDLYSLGIVLFEMLAGRPPFEGSSPSAILLKHLSSPLPSLREKCPDVHKEMEGLVAYLTQKNPEQRPVSHGQLLAVAKNLFSTAERLPTVSMRRINHIPWAAVVLIAALTGGLVYFTRFYERGSKRTIPNYRQTTFTGDASLPALSPDGKYLAYITQQILMLHDLASNESVRLQGARKLDIYSKLEWSKDGSKLLVSGAALDMYEQFLIPRIGGNPRILRLPPITALSRDVSQIASGFSNKPDLIGITDLSNGSFRTINIAGNHTLLVGLDWGSSDWLLLLVYDSKRKMSEIIAVRADGTKQTKITEDQHDLASPLWSADGRFIYYLQKKESAANLLRIRFDPEEGKSIKSPVPILTGLESSDFFSISADGRRLAFSRASTHGELLSAALIRTRGEQSFQVQRLTSGTHKVNDARLSPDGKRIVFCIGAPPNANIFIMPITGGTPEQVTFRKGYNCGPVWSPDGNEIAFGSIQGDKTELWKMNLRTGRLKQFTRAQIGSNLTIAWAPGEKILYQRDKVQNFQVLDPRTETEATLIQEYPGGWTHTPRYSPEAQQVVLYWFHRSAADPHQVWLISEDGSERRLPYSETGEFYPVGWSKHANWIYGFHLPTSKIAKLSVADGRFVKLPELNLPWNPADYNFSIDMAPDEKTFLFNIPVTRSDIWIVDNFDPDQSN